MSCTKKTVALTPTRDMYTCVLQRHTLAEQKKFFTIQEVGYWLASYSEPGKTPSSDSDHWNAEYRLEVIP